MRKIAAKPRRVLLQKISGNIDRNVNLDARGGDIPPEAPDEAPAIVIYTSGTTGPPKGAVLPRRSIASNLDALAEAWEWTDRDVVAHALPLFHVHGLILGILGPIRRGGGAYHLGDLQGGFRAALVEQDDELLATEADDRVGAGWHERAGHDRHARPGTLGICAFRGAIE